MAGGDRLGSLQIDAVEIRGGGAIGLAPEADPEVFRVFDPVAVAEEEEHGGALASGSGVERHRLPVKEAEAPDEWFEDLWTYAGLRLRGHLARGGKVAICGSAPVALVAAKLLVEFGEDAAEAIRRVRRVWPEAIKTVAQEAYVGACTAVASARVDRSFEERALACLLGGAVGDGLGYAVEFERLHRIRERFGEDGIQAPVLRGGKLVVSDDTQMTLFSLEGMIRGKAEGAQFGEPEMLASIRRAYLEWYVTQVGTRPAEGAEGWLVRQPEMWSERAPGNTCLAALGAGGGGTIENPVNHSKGCGGVMRAAPFGLIGESEGAPTAFEVAAEAAALTHGHPSGYLSAGVMAAMVHFVAGGVSWIGTREPGGEVIARSSELLRDYPGHEETLGAIKRAVARASERPRHGGVAEQVETLGGGWTGDEALAIALFAFLRARSFTEAVCAGANHSGDSDSTAAIAGQLWGVTHGLEEIPHDWVMALDVLRPLLHLARRTFFRY
jgi:ADP-ribosyl-[dinitrogen reductase] hydrolase